jgi:hypothetical protein
MIWSKMNKTLLFSIILLFSTILSGCNLPGMQSNTASANTPNLLFEDSFSNPNSGWEVSSQGGLKDYYNGTYHIQISETNIFSWSVAQQSYGDIVISVDSAFTGPANMAEIGVICRMQNSQDFYFMTIRSDGAYAVFKMYQGNEFFIGMDGYEFTEAIRTGLSTNHIEAECRGENLSLVVNNEHLITVQDSSYQVGDVGILAGAYDEPGVNVYFDNFRVFQP